MEHGAVVAHKIGVAVDGDDTPLEHEDEDEGASTVFPVVPTALAVAAAVDSVADVTGDSVREAMAYVDDESHGRRDDGDA